MKFMRILFLSLCPKCIVFYFFLFLRSNGTKKILNWLCCTDRYIVYNTCVSNFFLSMPKVFFQIVQSFSFWSGFFRILPILYILTQKIQRRNQNSLKFPYLVSIQFRRNLEWKKVRKFGIVPNYAYYQENVIFPQNIHFTKFFFWGCYCGTYPVNIFICTPRDIIRTFYQLCSTTYFDSSILKLCQTLLAK